MLDRNPILEQEEKKLHSFVFWIAAVIIIFWALGSRALGGSEGRWAEIARGMLLTGDWFHPYINHETYFDKPLLSYWMIAGLAWITGVLNEWTVRIPSALSALVGLWATVRLGRALWSEKVGIAAGWLLLTTYGFLFWAKKGDADIQNMAAITLAVSWFFQRKDKPGFVSYFVFYLICFLGAQTKGLPAIVIPFVALFPYFIREKRWLGHFRFSHFAAFACGLAIYLVPFIYAGVTREHSATGEISAVLEKSHESGLYMVIRENIVRFFEPFDHKDPFYSYLIHLPRLFLPWSPLLVLGLISAFANYKKLGPHSKWLLEAIVLIFLFFSASGSRRWYYILPILPFCAVFTSVFLASDMATKWKRAFLVLTGIVFLFISLVEISVPLVASTLAAKFKLVSSDFPLIAHTAIIGAAALLPWFVKNQMPGLLASLTGLSKNFATFAVVAYVVLLGFFCVQYTDLDDFRTEKSFSLYLKEETAPLDPGRIGFYLKVPTKLVFYMDRRRPFRILNSPDEVKAFLNSGSGVFIVERKFLKYLPDDIAAKIDSEPDFEEKCYPWEKKKKKLAGIKFGNGSKPASGNKR